MIETLKKIETEDFSIYIDETYSEDLYQRARNVLEMLVSEEKIEGRFQDDKWKCLEDCHQLTINFALDEEKYNKNFGQIYSISSNTFIKMLKTYAVYIFWESSTFGLKVRINTIIYFAEHLNNNNNNKNIKIENYNYVREFLLFIATPYQDIEEFEKKMKTKASALTQRELAHPINYLALENEINTLYAKELDDETFKKYFPVYAWVNLTFILPLRANEFALTPFNCIQRRGSKVFITIRRSKLKGQKKQIVYHDVNQDYRLYQYEWPDNDLIMNIEKYQELTKDQKRKYLFEIPKYAILKMMTKNIINKRLQDFVKKYMIGNPKYDYVRYAAGIDEFESMTLGDSRPIALANLYFNNTAADICRQLAGHENILTTSDYYSNVSETIFSSSVMQLHKIAEKNRGDVKKEISIVAEKLKLGCTSERRKVNPGDISDCEDALEDCIGCVHYNPTEPEIDAYMRMLQSKLDNSSAQAAKLLTDTLKVKTDFELDELLLQVQRDGVRYKLASDKKAKEVYDKWERLKNSEKICS